MYKEAIRTRTRDTSATRPAADRKISGNNSAKGFVDNRQSTIKVRQLKSKIQNSKRHKIRIPAAPKPDAGNSPLRRLDTKTEESSSETEEQAAAQAPIQRKLIFNAEETLYSLEGTDVEYAYVGVMKGTHYYVLADDLPAIKNVAGDIWNKVKEGFGSGQKKKIKEGEAPGGNFEANPELAPGQEKYEEIRRTETTRHIVGIAAPGKAKFQDLVKAGEPWEALNFYYPNDADDEKATAMTAKAASELAEEGKEDETFTQLLIPIMINAGQPREKSVGGGGMDRTAKAVGTAYYRQGEVIDWDNDQNPYKDYIASITKTPVADLNAEKMKPGAEQLNILGKEVVYFGVGESKARTGKKFYVKGKGYTRQQINDQKDDDIINTPWNELKAKQPEKQEATTFERKDRGKGQADAMGGWSANAAVVARNIKEGTDHKENLAYEWLHLRGAGLGGVTKAGNLTPGSYSANSEMIPIESKLKTLKSNPDVEPGGLKAEFTPKNIAGVFCTSIEMNIKAKYKGVETPHEGLWVIDVWRGSVYDKVQDKRLRLDLEGKVVSLVGKKVDLVREADQSILEHVAVTAQQDDTHFKVQLNAVGTWVIAEKRDNKFQVSDASLNQALSEQAIIDARANSAPTYNHQFYTDFRQAYTDGFTDSQAGQANANLSNAYAAGWQDYRDGINDAKAEQPNANLSHAYSIGWQEYRAGYQAGEQYQQYNDDGTYAFDTGYNDAIAAGPPVAKRQKSNTD